MVGRKDSEMVLLINGIITLWIIGIFTEGCSGQQNDWLLQELSGTHLRISIYAVCYNYTHSDELLLSLKHLTCCRTPLGQLNNDTQMGQLRMKVVLWILPITWVKHLMWRNQSSDFYIKLSFNNNKNIIFLVTLSYPLVKKKYRSMAHFKLKLIY